MWAARGKQQREERKMCANALAREVSELSLFCSAPAEGVSRQRGSADKRGTPQPYREGAHARLLILTVSASRHDFAEVDSIYRRKILPDMIGVPASSANTVSTQPFPHSLLPHHLRGQDVQIEHIAVNRLSAERVE
jgi:hypothetical protein